MTGLNIASGLHPCPGWVNVDVPWPGVTPGGLMVYADAFALPFPAATFDRIYLGHFIEHLWWHDIAAGQLDELWRVCTPNAEVMVVGPCIKRALDDHEPEHILRAILGAGESGWLIDGPGGHKWVPTEALTMRAMVLAGLAEIEPVDVRNVMRPEWPNTVPSTWQCALRARVPSERSRRGDVVRGSRLSGVALAGADAPGG